MMASEPKIALVTGGSRGIGRAICLELAKTNHFVLVNYVSHQAKAEDVVSEIKSLGGQAEAIGFDVANSEQVNKQLNAWLEKSAKKNIDVIVNNAGIRKDNLMVFMKDEEWDDVLQISLQGFYNVTKTLLQGMVAKRSGRIINVVSLSGVKGMPGQVNYAAAKAAVIGATKSLAQELAKRKITVNAVAPGFIETDMTADIEAENYKQIIPMGRFGKPEEVAALVSFLASDAASYITGEVIHINGGLYT